MQAIENGCNVFHRQYGAGSVEINKGQTALVRFEHGYEECLTHDLEIKQGLLESLASGDSQPARRVINKSLAMTLRSVNDNWGVFSRSKISLLPHQLWVCHRVLRQWPTQHLIADDVGLGKTIEAGLILWPLLAKKRVRRLLVLTPAPLVEQWQQRLRQMFDIRLSIYTPQTDTARTDYWNTHHQVVASLPTLRKDVNGRHQRMLEAEDWDLLIIDEAHHLNAIEDTGATLGYRFVQKLIENKKFASKLFFSGTPHRGKDYGFFALLRLLRSDLFDPDTMQPEQMRESVGNVLIRNNKQNVTDMTGNKLFKPVNVMSRTYDYSPEEEEFYKLLTSFILSGQAYASSLSIRDQKAVMLVLTAMQKLASSSVAAIRRAIRGRLSRHEEHQKRLAEIQQRQEELTEKVREFQASNSAPELTDEWQVLEEEFASTSIKVQLMNDELPRMKELLAAAERIQSETRIKRIIDILESDFENRTVVFFTEYKATQALLMGELHRQYGDGCVSFINGEDRLDNVRNADERLQTYTMNRYTAAEKFKSGKVRFIISTEAGGEGIDLQDNCYSMIHVDLPWNPMRLHQRVGRLNRYGQKHQVDVITLRNPATVESRIWDLLNSKIESIMRALGSAMDEPEDLMQLILGMSDSQVFNELFADSLSRQPKDLGSWFDAKTQTLGGKPIVDKVRDLIGRAEKFDYTDLDDVPRLDLQDLQPFFESMLLMNSRRPKSDESGMSFKTPEAWLTDIAVKRSYRQIIFDRAASQENQNVSIVGFGHPLFGKAIDQAVDLNDSVTVVKGNIGDFVLFAIQDRLTSTDTTVNISTAGVQITPEGECKLLNDETVVGILNTLLKVSEPKCPEYDSKSALKQLQLATRHLEQHIQSLGLPFTLPDIKPLAFIRSSDE